MPLSESQKRQLCVQRRGLAGVGGVLLVGGFLGVWFAVPSSLGWWLGWGLIGIGIFSLLMAGAMFCFPGFMLHAEHRERKKPRRAA
jgi:hypothetical protein